MKIENLMARLTKALDNNDHYIVDDTVVHHEANGYSGGAVIKLARFENLYDDLVSKQIKISEDLERLRSEDKTHSVKFKQLLTEKITNNNMLILFKSYGL